MRIALVNPLLPSRLQRHRSGVGHLGLGYVAAALLKCGQEVRVIDAKSEGLDLAEVVARVKEFQPDVFGATAMTHEICYVGELCSAVKELFPQCVTLVGGPHSTALPERTLREFVSIDVAVVGEGEEAACELARAVESAAKRCEWNSIPGIAYRDCGEVRRTGERPWISDLDRLPLPAWELFPRGVDWPVFAGRGCPFRCAFCQRVLGSKVRLRSVDSVLAEFDEMERRLGVKGTWFQDETFGIDQKWANEFLDKLGRRNALRGYKWRWKCNSRINLASKELYRRMKDAGCCEVDFGIESGDPAIIDKVHKGIRLDQVREAVGFAREAGLHTNGFFIIGHPGETWKSALRTVRFAARCGVDSIAVGVMVPYPGTEVWEYAKKGEHGYRLVTEDWRAYDKYFGNALELQSLTHRQLDGLQIVTYVWFHMRNFRIRDMVKSARMFSKELAAMLGRVFFGHGYHSTG